VSRTSRPRDLASGLGLERFVPPAWLLGTLLALGAIAAAPSMAASAGPHWSIVSQSQPSFFEAGDSADAYRLILRNDGALPTTRGSAVTVTDTLPAGLTATKISARGEGADGTGSPRYEMTCPAGPVTETVTCTYAEGARQGPVLPGATIAVTITVSVAEGVQRLEANSATVSGGGAQSASTTEVTPIDDEPVPFGLSFFDVDIAEESGEADTQAGSHPYELTAELAFNVSAREVPSPVNGGAESPLADASAKDLEVELPPGLVGAPNAVPQCSQQAFQTVEKLNCPLDTQVGTVKPYFYGSFQSTFFPVFNLVPPPGQLAELGFSVAGIGHVPIFFHLRGDGDYGLTAALNDIPEAGPLQGAILTLWGVPADGTHDLEREGTLGQGRQQQGEFCKPSVEVEGGVEKQKRCPSDVAAKPFLTLPSQCQTAKLAVGVLSDSWQNPGPPLRPFLPEPIAATALTGCEALSFDPSLALAPETAQAGAPSGYTIELHVPQSEDPSGLATADLRTAVVSLPAGAVISPSGADGLQGCSQEQFEPHSLAPASCPAQSQIGTVRITTPLLSSPLEGQLFLGEPECAPCTPADAQHGRLIRLLVQAQGLGVTVKLEGSTSIDQSTGQLTARFEESPQLPFEDVKLTLDGGARAPLANPSDCGVGLAASSWLTPYSSEWPAQPSSEPFEVSGCQPPRFQPSFVAGTTHNQAGAFSPLTVTLARTDEDEDFEGVTVYLPPGLLGVLAGVQLCPQSQAQAGACGAQSQIGTATVGAGPGPDPLFVGGEVYLTGPYDGAPFGLSIVVPALAGPFDLGTIDVGAGIEVSPSTAALTIASGPLPQRLDGIPLQIKTVNLDIDRERFIFNPTDCRAQAIEGALESSGGAAALVATPFQAADCATLAFKPKLTALTHAKTGKAGGAYLHVRVVFAPGQANIAKVKVDLPKQLDPRLSTLQQACAAAVLEVDPAGCPAASVVGSATVITPVLNQPLAGPAYLVSHGTSAPPGLELVLQGEGVTVDVVEQTSIEQGVASGVFRSLPDAPFSTFDLVLDEGPHSLLAANLPTKARGSMCGQRLAMPIAITAQNGAVVKHTTEIAVSGCPKRRASKRRA
jgi:uncharacterized repeat protein (TIGR01451 family)